MVKQNLHDHFWRDKFLDKSNARGWVQDTQITSLWLFQTLNEYMSIMMMSMCALCSVDRNEWHSSEIKMRLGSCDAPINATLMSSDESDLCRWIDHQWWLATISDHQWWLVIISDKSSLFRNIYIYYYHCYAFSLIPFLINFDTCLKRNFTRHNKDILTYRNGAP